MNCYIFDSIPKLYNKYRHRRMTVAALYAKTEEFDEREK
jgi:hypothetical protein